MFREVINTISPYIPGKPISEVKRELGLEKVIKLASNENPLGPSENVKKALMQNLDELGIYPDGNCTELKLKLSKKLGVKPSQILLGAGSDEITQFIAAVFINPGDNAIMAKPSFPRYETVTKVMGGVPIELPLKDFTHDLEAFYNNINERTKVIWICNPNNPTGTIVKRKELYDFIKSVPSHIAVVVDQAYKEYIDDPEYPDATEWLYEFENLIVLQTFSKIYGLASLRIGYVMASEEIIEKLNRVRPPFNVNHLAQIAASAALDDEEHVKKAKELNKKSLEFFYKNFEEMGLFYIKSYGNFVMVDVKKDAVDVFKKLLLKGIIVRPGDIFGMPTYLRVTTGQEGDNMGFIKALKEIL
ncbi:histidinol-phosphate aminotransferase [Caldicellulosiruptor bescii]|uniref:Histidinol-phosphate aminotransferase n=2 Tax=Caldicellulosiruptor bescii TaxID=31899 RepID=B9MQK7_CALBD|nr:histidinol-phosphate transaminase [Caldicellulosiruptor bescii]ACM59961.1 histidinol-phosphate aminotransferase [Caldicellulosiruptor bescii DSM 6725]PBC87372.1 histidinol-phosphate aminotransferase [Caldicellulosiruptor bescii]PBC90312.1 histidinol-phosphate aminotransferase [Caldicellulosiruptor bescii]PBD04260.1 histidinol-phosphate aminotransferase [Caldicellulosiruptor bescii]PBD06109.1 histidinol-phosphate aminotransferase [Caldicellulosiruptor bescii]